MELELHPEERLAGLAVRIFRATALSLRLRLAGLESILRYEPWDGEVRTEEREPALLRKRSARMKGGAALALLAGLTIAILYAVRHVFYATSWRTPALIGLSVVLALVVALAAALASLPQARRLRPAWIATLALLLVTLLTEASLARTGLPSLHHVRQLLVSGRPAAMEEALREAAAAADLGIDVAEAEGLHDRILLAQAGAVTTPAEAWRVSALAFRRKESRRRAEEAAARWTSAEVQRLRQAEDYAAALQVLSQAPEAQRRQVPLRDLFDDLHRHEGERLWRAMHARVPLAERARACEEMVPHVEALGSFRPVQRSAALEAPSLEALCAGLRDAERADEARRRAEQAKVEERARLQEERRKRRSWDSWVSAPLLCRDGALSPSCVCGGSHRGCCSHHGGVAGCSVTLP